VPDGDGVPVLVEDAEPVCVSVELDVSEEVAETVAVLDTLLVCVALNVAVIEPVMVDVAD
jgi:hypothetical protein